MGMRIFLLAVALFHTLMACLAMALTNIATDQSALLAFKSGLGLDPSHVLSRNWSVSFPTCKWIGVTCTSRHQRVSALDVSGMGLSGNLPSQLGNLSFLVSLNLSYNDFRGQLPKELSKLRRLRSLDFMLNGFTGDIPSWLGTLVEIRYLRLRNNSFTGSIPSSITNMSKLEKLDLSFNPLQGNIPEAIGRLLNLKELLLQFNYLTGVIPVSVFNISGMEMLYFYGNSLSGNLPDGMCRGLSNLKRFSLGFNELEGQLPPNISGCSNLSVLYLSNNKFSGPIPREIGNLRSLEVLALYSNHFTGQIPEGIDGCSKLEYFMVHDNNLTGSIPKAIGNLTMLKLLNIWSNKLTGTIPEEMDNLYNLEFLNLGSNNLTGHFSLVWKEGQPNLQELFFGDNFFYGEIPGFLSNSSKLEILSIEDNSFSGQVPKYFFSKLNLLEDLFLHRNKFFSETSELSFIGPMKNCSHLRYVVLDENPFNGILPTAVGNLSTSIQYFYACKCGLRGSIPEGFGNLEYLSRLYLSGNDLTGAIPNTFVNLKGLQGLDLSENKIGGSIPNTLCTLPNLFGMGLNQNQITGPIPDCIGNITSLRKLYLMHNRLNFVIPTNLWKLRDLLVLDLASNLLTGFLPPDIGNLKVAVGIDLSKNQLSGTIPSSIRCLESVGYLNLSQNRFQGSIPESMGKLVSLEMLDLSHNNLSGGIPSSLEGLPFLEYFDVSFNKLSGLIPTGGPFKIFLSQFFMSNGGLCGDPRYGVPPCHEINTVAESKRKEVIFRVVYILLGISMLVFLVTLSYIRVRYHKKNKTETPTDISFNTAPSRVLYHELVKATEGYNERHLLGRGSYGCVYRGRLHNGEDVAVKVFNMHSDGRFKSFDTECELLRRLRHRNICRVIGSCSTEDFKALVLKYMPNGSLEKLLYLENKFLNIVQRLNIMIDVACALEYLHDSYTVPIVHCDLKPSNVLLDDDMIAHLSDFGVAKLLNNGVSISFTRTLATLGYMAPEFGSEGLVSVRCDVYSYGIMLMEVFTRTKPNDSKFTGDLSLRRWVNDYTPNAIIHVIDLELLDADEEYLTEKLGCLVSIMEIALKCSMENPNDRTIDMKYVIVALKKIMSKLLQYSP